MDVGRLALRLVLGGALLAPAHSKLGRSDRPDTEAFIDEMRFALPRLVRRARQPRERRIDRALSPVAAEAA